MRISPFGGVDVQAFTSGIPRVILNVAVVILREVPFTEHVISTTADAAHSVFATDVDGDGGNFGAAPPGMTLTCIAHSNCLNKLLFYVDSVVQG